MDTVTPTENTGPSWGWGQLPNVPRKLSDPQIQNNTTSVSPSISEENKDEENAGMSDFIRIVSASFYHQFNFFID